MNKRIIILGLAINFICLIEAATPFPIAINSPSGEEYGPVMSADDNTLYFTGLNRRDNMGLEDIYCSKRKNGEWQPAEIVYSLSTPNRNEAPTSLSTDGSTMLLFSDGRLMLSQRTSHGWSQPVALPKNLVISSWQADAMISSDGQALLFAAYCRADNEEKPSVNIFVSTRDKQGRWQSPVSLGPTINTDKMDRSPFLHPDMQTLYFSSEGHETKGGLDVFVSHRLNDSTWTEWSEPVNLGPEINSSGNDNWYKISTDGQKAYFAKKEGKKHDIYWTELPSALRPNPVTTIMGNVVCNDLTAIYTSIRWEDLSTNKSLGQAITNPADGSYLIVLPAGKLYGYYVDDDRFYPVSDHIDLRNQDSIQQLLCNIHLYTYQQLIRDSLAVPLNNLFFDVDKADILPSSYLELDRLATIIQQKHLKVEIAGHTDNTGNAQSNQQLSEQRATAVKDYLIHKGCPPAVIQTIGYGATHPCDTNDTSEGRQRNRRVEVRFTRE